MGLNVISGGLLILCFIGLAISSGFLANATRLITTIPEYGSDKDLASAHKFGTIGSVVGWISVAALLIAGVLLFIFASEILIGFSKIFIYGFLFLALVGTIVVAILSILVAVYINRAKVPDNKNSYKQAVISAVLASIVGVFVLVAFLVRLFYKPKPKTQKVDTEISQLKLELGETGGDTLDDQIAKLKMQTNAET